MLILRRNVNEQILIGDNILITITDAGQGWAKVGIEAPRDIPVLRSELSAFTPDKEPDRNGAADHRTD